MNLTISGQTQSVLLTVSGYIKYPLTALVNSRSALVTVVNNRRIVEGSRLAWVTNLQLTFSMLPIGTYAYSISTGTTTIASGDLEITAPQPITALKTINGNSIIGTGDLSIGSTFAGTLDNIPDGETYYKVTETQIIAFTEAYSHSQSEHAPANAQKNSDISKEEIEAKLTGAITSHTHTAGGLTQQQIMRMI